METIEQRADRIFRYLHRLEIEAMLSVAEFNGDTYLCLKEKGIITDSGLFTEFGRLVYDKVYEAN